MDHAADPGPYIPCKLNYPDEIKQYIADNYPGLEAIPDRTITDALRRWELEHYQIGQKRYTTPRMIDQWLMSRRSAPRPGTKPPAAVAKS